MASKTDSRARLHRASDQQTLVRVSRDLKFADRLTVFILEVGERWVLAQSVEDGGYADGYIAFRLKDVRKVERD